MADESRRTAVREATKSPCQACPWLTANQGKHTPDGWYTKANLRRLWAGLRTGEAPGMTCHPTDPDNPVSEAGIAAGLKAAPEGAVTRECAGSIILQQREVDLFQRVDGDFATYRSGRPGAMTRVALFGFAMRMAVQVPGDIRVRRDHDLNTPVGVPDQVPWEPPENRAVRPEPSSTSGEVSS
ncbi:hypothetical protein [Nocardioides bruguierae]|uniref:Uncharacterized protein n=1 Tax=Nocardioides bruguierae TaxID=2945102 RepID=A0A9X2D5Z9_9ACTN|nr:hypothetical protein [Nocardioides bruguierae]MCM0619801.1 hypothetical protein [Nocardioides bruguierae]